MSRFQMSINVTNVNEAVEFYTKLLGVEPAKLREGYANFVVADPPMKLIVVEDEGEPGSINHLGIEYDDGIEVAAKTRIVADAGLDVEVDDPHTCCYATQEKAWAKDPEGIAWEIYTVVADTEHFGASPRGGVPTYRVLPPVTVEELEHALKTNEATVIDAQGGDEYDQRHIPGAVDFSFEEVVSQAAEQLSSLDAPVIVYCSDVGCDGSEIMGTILIKSGYTNVRRFPGGLAEWVSSGRPVSEPTSVA